MHHGKARSTTLAGQTTPTPKLAGNATAPRLTHLSVLLLLVLHNAAWITPLQQQLQHCPS
jgi:hypothetical protein